jgi:hypothetical protein
VSGALGGSFGVRLNPRLERNEIRGEPARVRLDRDVLVIEGAVSGRLAIAAARVARLRLYVHASKVRTFYEARIRVSGGRGGEIALLPIGESGVYRDVMREFAQAIAAAGGLRRIEAGRSRLMAWAVYPALVLLLASLTFATGSHALRTGAIGDWLVAAAFAALFALFLPALFGIRIRPVASVKAIDALLPPD